MRRVQRALKERASMVTGFLAVLALVSLPVEVRIALVEHPVVAPTPVVSLLLIGSCLLLVGSGLGLRRLETARANIARPTPGV